MTETYQFFFWNMYFIWTFKILPIDTNTVQVFVTTYLDYMLAYRLNLT